MLNPPHRHPLAIRDLARALLALAGLSSLGIAHPLLDLLGRNPQFLIVHHVQGWDLVLLVAGLTLGPALVLGMLAGIAGLVNGRLGKYVLAGAATILVTILMAPMLKGLTVVPGFVVTGASLVLALLIVIKLGPNRKLFAIWNLLGLVPLLVAGFFFAQPGPRSILFPEQLEPERPTSGQTPPNPDIPVVLVVFDAFSTVSIMAGDGGIDSALCPNIAAFADDAVWYRNALSISDDTMLAVPAILTGNLPRPGQQPTKAWLPDNLFSGLAPWRNIHSLESHTQLGTVQAPSFWQRWRLTLSDLWVVFLHTNLPAQYTGNLPSISHDWRGFAADGPAGDEHSGLPDRLDLFDAFLASLATGETGACHFLHLLFPHTPYEFLPSGRRYSVGGREVSGEGMQWGKWSDDLQVVVHSQQRHLAQVGYVDKLVGQIVATLEGAGIYEQALVVFTADHGMGFSAGDSRRRLGPTNGGDILPVPLLIKYPGPAQGTVDERAVQTIDILPTVGAVLGTAVPWSTDGRNLLDPSYEGHATTRAYQAKPPWETEELDVADLLTGREASLLDKIRRFPGRDRERPLSAPVRGQALLGTPVPHELPRISQWSLSMAGSGLRTVPGSPLDLVPAEVHGHVSGKDPFPSHLDIAVLVDGRIAAVTRPFRKSGIWSTLLPDDFLSPGDHVIGTVLVDWSTNPPQLFSVDHGKMSVIGQNLLLDAMFVYRKSGFYGLGSWDGEPRIWTNGIGEIRVRIPDTDRPKTLELTVHGGTRQGAYMVAFANGSLIGAGSLEGFPWSGSLDLSAVRISDHLRLSFFSSTFVPAESDSTSSDRRTLGLAMGRIELRSDAKVRSGRSQAPAGLPKPFGRELGPGLPDGGQWSGVYETVDRDGFPATWTNGKATCVMTWDRPRPPRYLFVELAGTVPGGTPLSIDINGAEVAVIEHVSGDWFGMIDLGDIEPSERLSITLTSKSRVTAEDESQSADDRPLGVALRTMTLLEKF